MYIMGLIGFSLQNYATHLQNGARISQENDLIPFKVKGCKSSYLLSQWKYLYSAKQYTTEKVV